MFFGGGPKVKIKTIKLTDGHAPKKGTFSTVEDWEMAARFRVEQVTDSIQYRTGQFLERSDVEALCAAEDWKVTIVPFKP